MTASGSCAGVANGHVLDIAVGVVNKPAAMDRSPIMKCLVESGLVKQGC